MGKGTIGNKPSYRTKRGYYVSSDYDERVGGKFDFLLEPLYGNEDERFFYVLRQEDGRYAVTGEGYTITEKESLYRHLKELRKELQGQAIWYYHINREGTVVRKEKAMNYKLEQVHPSQVRLLFAVDKEDTFEKHKIGHLRGDFGSSGNQFFSTWFPVHDELKTQRFREELQQVIDELRSDSEFPLLKNRNSMRSVCMAHLHNRVPGGWHPDTFGFKIRTEHYWYFFKCYYGGGDYNFYCNCFADDPDTEKRLAEQEKQQADMNKKSEE